MTINVDLDVRHVARIEGHANVRVKIEAGELKEARWEVVETPRYFEVMLKGKHYTSAAVLSARICGICSISHCLASLRATESAFGIRVPERAEKLRYLAKHGETLQSHYLHLFFLAAPDFYRIPSLIPLLEDKPEVVNLAVRLRGLANRLCDVVAGRATHPLCLQVGGVSRVPREEELLSLRKELEASLRDIAQLVELFGGFEIPQFVRETEFVSLRGDGEYPFLGSEVVSTDGVRRAATDYRQMTNEYVDDENTSKLCKLSRESLAVGALARFNNNHQAMHQQALEVAATLGLEPVCHNPFMNNVAQIAECLHCTYDCMRLIDEVVSDNEKDILSPVEARAGTGVGAVEAPRGVLYHEYEYDESGRIARANCVIPTTQNNANIQRDLEELVIQYAKQGLSSEELERMACMLVRSYDPCVSCSVH